MVWLLSMSESNGDSEKLGNISIMQVVIIIKIIIKSKFHLLGLYFFNLDVQDDGDKFLKKLRKSKKVEVNFDIFFIFNQNHPFSGNDETLSHPFKAIRGLTGTLGGISSRLLLVFIYF